ncbi:ALDH-like protein, partial [Suillus hirtellus]
LTTVRIVLQVLISLFKRAYTTSSWTSLTEQVRTIKVGDPFSPDTYQGPQVSNTQFERIMGYIASGQKDGATVHLGSKQIGQEGYFIEPIIFILSRPKMVRLLLLHNHHIPNNFSEVVEQANDTSYRLAALVFTKDINGAIRIAHAFEAGTAWINCSNQAEILMPFRGFMQSGIGHDLSKYALEK